jgi:hypothetical protein
MLAPRMAVLAAVLLGTARPHKVLCGACACRNPWAGSSSGPPCRRVCCSGRARYALESVGACASAERTGGGGDRLCPRTLVLRGGDAEPDSSADPEMMVKIRKKEQRGRKKLERSGRLGTVGKAGVATGKRARAQESQALSLKKQRHAEQALQERETQLLRRQSAVRQQLGVRTPGDLQAVLYKGVERGDVFVVDRCIFAGAQVTSNYSSAPLDDPLGLWNASTVYDATCLHVAARNNHTAVIGRLLQARADVNARTRFGFTPLMTAAHRGSLAAAMALVEAGADVHAAGEDGYTAAELAETYASDWRVALWFRQVLAWLASPGSSAAAGRHRVPMPRPLGPNEYPDPRALHTSMLRAPVNLREWSAPPASVPPAAPAAGPDGAHDSESMDELAGFEDEERIRSRFLIPDLDTDSLATGAVSSAVTAVPQPDAQTRARECHRVQHDAEAGAEKPPHADSENSAGGREDDAVQEQGAGEGVGEWEQVTGNPFE